MLTLQMLTSKDVKKNSEMITESKNNILCYLHKIAWESQIHTAGLINIRLARF